MAGEIMTHRTLVDGKSSVIAVEHTSPTTHTVAIRQGRRFDFEKKPVKILFVNGAFDTLESIDLALVAAEGIPYVVDAKTARGALRAARQGKAKPAA